ncbi:LAFE_0B06898g1_1 [Lachancea fermentati]|uniref:LAFE_0B06898g1_1 n=1 Tax=Lachancea fermentati TaxID=4955 RepID=A0A1G4M816_LACFM|nr:LAFE_0B06898g1_1 [Lachancea fermentati]
MILDRFHNKFHGSKGKRSDKVEDTLSEAENKNRMSLLAEEPEDMDWMSIDEQECDRKELKLNTQLASTIAQEGVSTPIMTPTTQPMIPYMYMNQRKQGSVSSLASSVSDLQFVPSNAARPANGSPFTQQFIRLMMDVYQEVCSDPTVTPFDTANPPSGILNKTAKAAVENAEFSGVEIGKEKNAWLITFVRQRLLHEVRKDGFRSRNSSMVSLPPMPQFGPSEASTMPPTDYFNINTEVTPQHLLSSPFTNSSINVNQSQPLQSPFEHRPVQPKTLLRSRNDSFISAAGRSRSGSTIYSMPQQLQTSSIQQIGNVPAQGNARSRSGSNNFFMLTPTNSIAGESQLPIISRQRSNTSRTFEEMMNMEIIERKREGFKDQRGGPQFQ